MSRQDEQHLLRILQESYVLDMYVGRNDGSVSSAFHPEFRMLIPTFDGRSGTVSDVSWLKLDKSARAVPKAIEPDQRFNCSVLDITGKIAICKVEAIRGGRLLYTDYVTFVKIDREWKVVAKAFHRHFTSGK